MSTTEERPEGTAEQDSYPEFDLECLYDDWADPATVTVFSTADGDSLDAAWLTADCEHAVELPAVR
ncbi:MAG: hypothetical protein ABEJ30_00780 [Halorientalis sp.]